MTVREMSSYETKDLKDYSGVDYVIPDQVLFSSGTWKGFYYSPEIVEKIYQETDWEQPNIKNLFLDHYDGTRDPFTAMMRGGVATWVGQVKNVRYDNKTHSIIGDAHVVDLNTVNKIAYPDTKFGVSVKFDPASYEETNSRKEVTDAKYSNTSVVIEPAVKTAYINNSEEQDFFKHFIKSIAKEVIEMTKEDKKEEDVKEEQEDSGSSEPEEAKEEMSAEQVKELAKAAELVLKFCKKQNLDNAEEDEEKEEDSEEESKEKEESEEEEEPEEKEEPKKEEEEKPKEEPKEEEKEEPKENSDSTKELLKAIKTLSTKINNSSQKEEPKNEIEGVEKIENSEKICPESEIDQGMTNFLGVVIKKNK